MRSVVIFLFHFVLLIGHVHVASSSFFPIESNRFSSEAKNTRIYSYDFRIDVIEHDGIPLDAVTVSGRNELGSLALVNNGGHLLFTSNNVFINVTNGVIAMNFMARDGTIFTLVAGAGNSIDYEPDSFTITSSVANSKAVSALIEGMEFLILPGQSTRFVEIGIMHINEDAFFSHHSQNLIPIVIFGSAHLDVSNIEIDSLFLEGLAAKGEGKANNHGTMDHINDDEYPDLIVQFEANKNFSNDGFSYAILNGQLSDGTTIKGISGLHLKY
jgi:hypothetical protein